MSSAQRPRSAKASEIDWNDLSSTGSSAEDVWTPNPSRVLRTLSCTRPEMFLTSASRSSTSLRSSGTTGIPSGYLMSMQVSFTRRTGRCMESR